MSVDRRPTDRYENNRSQAEKTALIQAEFIESNRHHLAKVDPTGKMQTAAKAFLTLLRNGEGLTPGQFSYLDAIFEKTHEGAGYPAVNTHHDKRPKGLKFG